MGLMHRVCLLIALIENLSVQAQLPNYIPTLEADLSTQLLPVLWEDGNGGRQRTTFSPGARLALRLLPEFEQEFSLTPFGEVSFYGGYPLKMEEMPAVLSNPGQTEGALANCDFSLLHLNVGGYAEYAGAPYMTDGIFLSGRVGLLGTFYRCNYVSDHPVSDLSTNFPDGQRVSLWYPTVMPGIGYEEDLEWLYVRGEIAWMFPFDLPRVKRLPYADIDRGWRFNIGFVIPLKQRF